MLIAARLILQELKEEEQMEGWADECPTCVDTQSFINTAHMR
jgi:hypothetical protein